MLDRAGRRAADRRRDLRGAPLGDHHSGRAGALGAAADGAEVLGVLDLVERDHQGLLAASQQLRGVGIRIGLRLAHESLVLGRAAQALELRRRHDLHRLRGTEAACRGGEANRPPPTPWRTAPAAPQRLEHGSCEP